jgi:limonene-1,2-epoxide hydrolase
MTHAERNEAAVRTVCERWPWLTIDEWRELLAPDCDYRNVPIAGDRHVGPDAVFAAVGRMQGSWDLTLEVRNLAVAGDVVLTERNEHFVHRAGTKPTFELPVMGTFELRDGRITAWRDYFELSQMKLR